MQCKPKSIQEIYPQVLSELYEPECISLNYRELLERIDIYCVSTSTARVVLSSNMAARRLSGKRKFEREHAAQASSSSTTAAAAEGDASAPPAPESVDFVVEREENTNESGDKTNGIAPGEKSVQTDMNCKDISLLQDEMNNITSEFNSRLLNELLLAMSKA